MRISETLATQPSLNLGINDNDYGPRNNMYCVQWCVCDVQGEGNAAVQLLVVGYGLECECQ
jgi:hypothetical protein